MKIVKNIALTFTFSVLMGTCVSAQAVAICGWDGDSGDRISFVLLRDFEAGEVIYFTEDEYSDAGNSFNTGEGHIAYTIPAGGLPENEVISITETGEDVFTVGCGVGGTAVIVPGTGSWSFSRSDEIYAYSASNSGMPWSSITEVHCFAWGSNIVVPVDQDPSSDWPNAIIITFNIGGPDGTNADFRDVSRLSTTLSVIQDGANWTQSNMALPILSCTDFTDQMLPVELVSFYAVEKEKMIQLSWQTSSETNNEKFEIEASQNGRDFLKIGEMRGRQTTLEQQDYSFDVFNPGIGISYYRLKQIDFDGQYEYSNVISINFRGEAGKIEGFYPNPSQSGMVNLRYVAQNDQSVFFSVFDFAGKRLIHESRQVVEGVNNLSFDFSGLNSGGFLIRIGDEKDGVYRKLILGR